MSKPKLRIRAGQSIAGAIDDQKILFQKRTKRYINYLLLSFFVLANILLLLKIDEVGSIPKLEDLTDSLINVERIECRTFKYKNKFGFESDFDLEIHSYGNHFVAVGIKKRHCDFISNLVKPNDDVHILHDKGLIFLLSLGERELLTTKTLMPVIESQYEIQTRSYVGALIFVWMYFIFHVLCFSFFKKEEQDVRRDYTNITDKAVFDSTVRESISTGTKFGILFLLSYYFFSNFLVYDFFNLTTEQYKILFWANAAVCALLGFSRNSEEKPTFLISEMGKIRKSSLNIAFHFSLILFSLWFVLYEEVVQLMHYNVVSGVAVIVCIISMHNVMIKLCATKEDKGTSAILRSKKLSAISIGIILVGIALVYAMVRFGTWYIRFI